ncbi:MAG: hypothetical protein ABI456_15305 [Ktedonobacteraceae bacterium]|nr:hypothetical protein [Chloroflexota bacterium]
MFTFTSFARRWFIVVQRALAIVLFSIPVKEDSIEPIFHFASQWKRLRLPGKYGTVFPTGVGSAVRPETDLKLGCSE